jgi:hypothetical protein
MHNKSLVEKYLMKNHGCVWHGKLVQVDYPEKSPTGDDDISQLD